MVTPAENLYLTQGENGGVTRKGGVGVLRSLENLDDDMISGNRMSLKNRCMGSITQERIYLVAEQRGVSVHRIQNLVL